MVLINKTQTTSKQDEQKLIRVHAICDGTVIDHIEPAKTVTILKVLNLENCDGVVTVGINLRSAKLGRKGLIKIESRELTDDEVNRLAILAPEATINIVRHYKVVEKIHPAMPKEVRGLVACPNPKCITNHERALTVFYPVAASEGGYKFKCRYCERSFNGRELVY